LKLSSFTTVYCNYPLEEAIKRIAKAGYDGVDLMAVRPHAWPQDFSAAERKNLLRLVRSFDIEVSAVTDFSAAIGLNFSSTKGKIRTEAIRYAKDCIELASDLESKFMMLIPGWLVLGESYEQAWKWAVKGLKECVPLAEEKDITIVIEPAFNLLNSVDSAIRMMKEVSSQNLGICLDTRLAHALNQPLAESVKKLGKDLAIVHVWDIGPQELPTPFGKGIIKFNELIKALTEIGYNGYLSVESPRSILGLPDPDEYARQSKDYLNTLLKKYER